MVKQHTVPQPSDLRLSASFLPLRHLKCNSLHLLLAPCRELWNHSGLGVNASPRQQSPFTGNPSATGATTGPPPPARAVSGSPSYGSGGYGVAPPRSDPGQRYGAPGGAGPPSGARSYPQPPQSNGAFAKVKSCFSFFSTVVHVEVRVAVFEKTAFCYMWVHNGLRN